MPSSLQRGVAATAANCKSYDANPNAFRSGAKKFDLTSSIYGTTVVKRKLKSDQHNKCAFCEAIFDANVSGDVEHYRPKGAVQTATAKILPGYYWLAYEWSNLSYACPDCNQYRKKDHFPLQDEAKRARSHRGNIRKEKPLLLDPYGSANPRAHIVFRGEAAVGLSPEGKATIDLLGLGRTALARDRLDHLNQLSVLHKAVLLLQTDTRQEAADWVTATRAKLASAILPQAKFSAAAADHLTELAAGRSYLPTPKV